MDNHSPPVHFDQSVLRRIRMKKIFLLITILTVPFMIMAQTVKPVAVLEYYEDDLALEITDADGNPVTDIYYGMELEEGDTIRTNGTVAELRLDPNGSIIKLANDTVFTIENLQKGDSDSNDFRLAAGKMRAIAARAGLTNRYTVKTQSAVCGVRGTDFGVISIPGTEERAFVIDGLVDYTKIGTNQTVSLGKGMMADALSDVFKAVQLSQQQMQDLVKDVVFTKLDPTKVPGHENEAEQTKPAETSEKGKAEEPQPPTKEDVKKQAVKHTQSALARMIGLEIGTVTIDGETWSKAVIQPTFNLGKLKMSLYLPIIYATDLFDPGDWYKPEGNNEWSFGTDSSFSNSDAVTEWKDRAQDFINDLFLKIRYIEWGKQRDPFFFKIGNLDDMTLGHGLIMNNYANDSDFPTVRRVGLDLGVDRKKGGFETVVNDLADPEIFGGRIYVRPLWKLAFGISGIVDINPDSAADPDENVASDTKFITAGADMDLPLLENDIMSVILFSDIAGMVPYQNGTLEYETLYDDSTSTFRNYGWNAGVFGNILFVKYNLQYRYFDGIFKPAFFDSKYDRMRGVYISEINDYLADPDNPKYDKVTMGIYGEAGFGIKKMFNVKMGYMWPWEEGKDPLDLEDEFLLSLDILPGTIPVVGVYGSVSYHRTDFLPTLLKEGSGADLSLFDANTVLSGEIVYPVAPTLNIAAVFATSVKMDDNGNIVYDNDTGLPKVIPSITIESRIGF